MDDSLKLLDNGHVELTFNDTTYNCRNPKGGEYWELRAAYIEMNDKIKALPEEPKGIERDKAVFVALGQWLVTVINKLSSTPFEGTTDDLPPWILNGQAVSDVMTHWTAVPLAPPGQ